MILFEVDDNNVIRITPEVRMIKAFKQIIERDKGSKGDHDGRHKKHAMKELCFVYHMCDVKSSYQRIPESDREETIIDDLGLEKWKPDELVKEAMLKYSSLKETVSERTLKEMKRTLESCVDTIQFLRESIETKIKDMKQNKDSSQLPDLVTLFSTTLTMAKDLPKNIKDISDLEQRVRKEQMEAEGNIRGDGSVGFFEK